MRKETGTRGLGSCWGNQMRDKHGANIEPCLCGALDCPRCYPVTKVVMGCPICSSCYKAQPPKTPMTWCTNGYESWEECPECATKHKGETWDVPVTTGRVRKEGG